MIVIKEEEPLSLHTTFRTGGLARFFIEANSSDDIRDSVLFSKKQNLPFVILGGGSNVLVGDLGFRGVIIHPLIKGMEIKKRGDDYLFRVGAGEEWDRAVSFAVSNNLWGIENLSFIPGSVGASPIQNIGAYGQEISNVIESARVFDSEKMEEKIFSPVDCRFSYRHSIFKEDFGKKYIVLEITLRLRGETSPNLSYKDVAQHFGNNSSPSLRQIREAVIAIRKEKLPSINDVGTAGSFFKNPIISNEKFNSLKLIYPDMPGVVYQSNVKISAAWLIDHVAHMKKAKEGSVGTWERQPLAIVNFGGATSSQIEKFAEIIEKKIFNETGIKLEWEVNKI